MYEKTEKEFLELFWTIQKENEDCFWDHGFEIGKENGKTFILIENHEAIIKLEALLNRYEGNLNFHRSWDNVNIEIDKCIKELETVNPEHLGTISRLNSQIKGLENLRTYQTWLSHQEDPVSLDSFEDVESGFSDEYQQCCGRCNGCENIVRTSPDSYCWTAPLNTDEGYVCDDCAHKYKDYVLEEYCNKQKSVPDQFSCKDLGLEKINDDSLQNGWHHGMNDTPEPIIKTLNASNIDVWFKVHPSQFYLEFDVYVKTSDADKAKELLNSTNTKLDYEPADRLAAALKSIPPIPSSPDGIVYTKINVDSGTSETRVVSKEEFVKGIKD